MTADPIITLDDTDGWHEYLQARPKAASVLDIPIVLYDPNEPRDDHGRWTDGGGGGESINSGGGKEEHLATLEPPARLEDITQDKAVLEMLAKDIAISDAQPPTYLIDTPEREALRASLAAKAYGDGANVKEREAWLVMGLPGAGKNKAVAEPLAKEHGAMLIDNDHIKEGLPEFHGGTGAQATHVESSTIMESVVMRAAMNGDNFVQPRVGRTYEGLYSDVSTLKAAGYKVHVVLVDVSPKNAATRALKRYVNGKSKGIARLVRLDYINSVDGSPGRNFGKIERSGVANSYSIYDNNGPPGTTRKVR